MAKTIGEYLTQNGYEIGRDAIRVKPDTRYKDVASNREGGMYLLNYYDADGFYFVGNGVGVIARPLTKEYYITQNDNLVRELAEHFNIEKTKNIIPCSSSYDIKFIDKKMQKAWTDHLEYMKPENVEARRYAKARSDRRAALREMYEESAQRLGIPPMGVKDVIRRGGFTPNDYVELKEGMVDLGPASASEDYKPKLRKEIKLPKEEDVAAKRYVVYDGNTYMIGNTDTNEAILTKNAELFEEFQQNGFVQIDEYDLPYKHHHYGTTFEDPKIQKRWETHQKEVKKQVALIKRQTQRYVTEHQDELKRRAGTLKKLHYASPEHVSDMKVMKDTANAEVLKQRAEARRSTRNMTVTRDEKRNDSLRETLSKHSAKVADKKAKEMETQKQSESPVQAPNPQTETKAPNLWQRLAQKFGGRG